MAILKKEEIKDRMTHIDLTAEFKAGICSMIEMVLHESGNYAGFHFNNMLAGNDTGTLEYYTRSYYYSNKMRQAA